MLVVSWFLFAWHNALTLSLFEQGTRTGNSQYDILGANLLSIFERKIHVGKGLEDKTKKKTETSWQLNFYQLIDF